MRLVGPDGKLYEIPDELAQQAVNDGLRPATGKDIARFEAAQRPVTTFAESALDTATFGLSRAGERALGVDPRDMALRKEMNPAADISGSIAGAVAGSMVPGSAPALIGRAGTSVAKGVAGKVASRAAQGAVEGGLYGLGSVISESIIQDKPVTAEKALATVLQSAALGGVANPLIGAAGDKVSDVASWGVDKVKQALGGRALKEYLDDAAGKAIVQQMANKSDLGKYNLRERSAEVGNYALEKGIVTGNVIEDTAEKVLARAEAAASAAKGSLDDILAKADDAVAPSVEQATAALERDLLAGLKGDPFRAKQAKLVEKEVLAPLRKVKNWRQLFEAQGALGEMVAATDAAAVSNPIYAARGVLRQELERQAEASGIQGLSQALRDYANANSVKGLAEGFAKKLQGNTLFSLPQMMLGAAGYGFGGPGGLVGAALIGAAKNRGGFLLGAAAKKLANSKSLTPTIKAFREAVMKGAERASPLARAALGAAESEADFLNVHASLAATDPEYLKSVGLGPETPEAVAGYSKRLAILDAMQEREAAFDAEANAKVQKFLTGKRENPEPLKIDEGEYKTLLGTLRELTRSPDAAAKLVPVDVHAEAPGLGAEVTAVTQRARQFLLDVAPKSNSPEIPALQPEWVPSRSQLAKWYRSVRAVQNPMTIYDDLARGGLTPEARLAVETVYPRIYEDFKMKVQENLASYKDLLPADKRLVVSQIIGPTGYRPSKSRLQANFKMEQQQTPQGGGGGSSDGRQVVSMDKALQSAAQRLEGRNQQ